MERTLWAPLRDRNVRLLVSSTGLSQIGDWLYNVALIVFVLERTGSGAWIAAAGIVRLLPYVAFGTVGGMIADRWPRRRTMIQSDLIRAAVMFALTIVAARDGSAQVAIVLAGIATTFSVAYSPCVNAAIPRIVGEDDLSAVNTLTATVTDGSSSDASRTIDLREAEIQEAPGLGWGGAGRIDARPVGSVSSTLRRPPARPRNRRFRTRPHRLRCRVLRRSLPVRRPAERRPFHRQARPPTSYPCPRPPSSRRRSRTPGWSSR